MTLPEGVRLILGPISMAKLVATCVASRAMARRALDEFLEHGEAMVVFDLDKFDHLVQPRRARWSSASSLIPRAKQIPSITEGMNMAQEKMASAEQVKALNHRLAHIEQQVGHIAKLASVGLSTQEAVQTLGKMTAGLHFYNPGDQSKNDAWNTPGGTVDTVDGKPLSLPADVTNPKMASARVLTANANIADDILTKLAETNERIDALVTAGRKFNASSAKADLHKLATDVQTILTEADLAMPYVQADLQKLAASAAKIHGLFASAKV